MIIKLLKNEGGFITGFISHIRYPEKHNAKDLIEIKNEDYKPLFYYLLGRNNVKQKKGIGSVKIGNLHLKDEGDFDKNHLKIQKDIFKFKPKNNLH